MILYVSNDNDAEHACTKISARFISQNKSSVDQRKSVKDKDPLRKEH